MTQTRNRPAGGGPASSSDGIGECLAATQASISDRWDFYTELVFDTGRMWESQRIADAVVELDEAWLNHARQTREERIAQRIDEMAPSSPFWLVDSADRLRDHDRRCIEIGLKYPPAYTTWDQVRESVTPRVWARIVEDLDPQTRKQIEERA